VRFLWVIAVVTGPHSGGPLSPGGTASRLCAIRRKTRPPKASFHPPSTTPSHNPPGKPITSSAAITHDGSASLAWGANPCRVPKRWPPIAAPSRISSATTLSQMRQHSLCSTTYASRSSPAPGAHGHGRLGRLHACWPRCIGERRSSESSRCAFPYREWRRSRSFTRAP
jgi:hypothetical protein